MRTTIVTGAGSGIGRAVAGMLAPEGHRLVLVGRRPMPLEETRRELGLAEGDALVVPADLACRDDVERIADAAIAAFGRVDGVVNNAGLVTARPLAETDWALLESTFAANVFGPFELVRRLLPTLRTRPGACVVNVSSMGTVDPFPGLAVYAASKAAIESLTRSIENEVGSDGVRSYAVAPGAVETAMLRSILDESVLPRDRTLRPDDVARVIVDCLLGRRPEPSGSTILVESG